MTLPIQSKPPKHKMPRGWRNKNPGNIRHAKGVRWQGQADHQPDAEFVAFTDHKWGIRAICRVLITYQDGRQAKDGSKIDCVRDIIERWAPPSENHTLTYQKRVAKLMNIGLDDRIDVYDWATMRGLVVAIITHELGSMPYDDTTIDSGLIAAGLQLPKQRMGLVTETSAVGVGTAGAVLSAIIQAAEAMRGATDGAQELAGPWLAAVPYGSAAVAIVVAIAVIVISLRLSARQRLTGA